MTEEFSKQQSNYRAFEELIAGEDATIDVAKVALLIATIEYPSLDTEHALATLDAFAYRVRAILNVSQTDTELPETIAPLTVIDAMNKVLFEEEGFRGNESDYYNPDNSFLNKVLEQHVGIPISLSLLYMEVGKRVGLLIEGIGLPFHFVVRCTLPTEILYIDPFEGGLLLSEQDCRERIRRFSQGKMSRLPRHFFEPVKPKQMLVRMLGNLKSIYLHKEDYTKALLVSHYILLLIPDAAREIRDRGIIHLQLKHYAKALHDLKAYVKLEPQASDRQEMQNHIKTIQQTIAMMN
jgi:regulator of sirC expression with transglutaminase-like and TPR domain